jgi:hypothetical protein
VHQEDVAAVDAWLAGKTGSETVTPYFKNANL